MNRILPKFFAFSAILILVFTQCEIAFAQKLSGQWIGSFNSKEDPSDAQTEYVLEIEINGNSLSGYSYTYFPIAGKRYFVICKLKGSYESGSKSLVVTEIEKVKSNTPPDFQNCLQTHKLTYFKQGNKETLEGKWEPAEKGSTCGTGISVFERKMLEKIKPVEVVKKQVPKTPAVTKQLTSKNPPVVSKPVVTKKTEQKKILPKKSN